MLSIKPFRALWIALSLSSLGDWLSILALVALAPAVTHGSTLALKGRSDFEGANVDLNGTIDLHGDFPGQIGLKFSNIDFNPLLQPYLKANLSSHSSIVGTVDVRGPMKRPG